MLEVTAQRIITRPQYQVLSSEVRLHGFDRLTPRAARAALEIAFGNDNGGVVWGQGYGYRIYEKSARKVVYPDR
jgi:hypothetical protein